MNRVFTLTFLTPYRFRRIVCASSNVVIPGVMPCQQFTCVQMTGSGVVVGIAVSLGVSGGCSVGESVQDAIQHSMTNTNRSRYIENPRYILPFTRVYANLNLIS